jgi:hypothetical protein
MHGVRSQSLLQLGRYSLPDMYVAESILHKLVHMSCLPGQLDELNRRGNERFIHEPASLPFQLPH